MTLGGIISVYSGGFVGIRSPRFCNETRPTRRGLHRQLAAVNQRYEVTSSSLLSGMWATDHFAGVSSVATCQPAQT
jgi:hypothetical protein